jgi:predicted transcriptional regulator
MPRAKNRNSLDIIAALLSASETASRKTHIMFGANLSHKLLENYLSKALAARLVAQKGKSSYATTRKGKTYLERYRTYVQCRRALNDAEKCFEKAQSTLSRVFLPETKKLTHTPAPSHMKGKREEATTGTERTNNLNAEITKESPQLMTLNPNVRRSKSSNRR